MKEEDIRKRDTFNQYLALVKADAVRFFADRSCFVYLDCPACGVKEFDFEFEKDGFRYLSCPSCFTLFVNPRPQLEAYKNFYAHSKSSIFFANQFFKPIAEVRRRQIFKPRVEYIKKILADSEPGLIGDIGAGFGLFLEELRKVLPDNRYLAIEPSMQMVNILTEKGLEVKRSCFEDIDGMQGSFDLLSAFELVEHLFDPFSFFQKAYTMLKPGGYLFLTTLNAQGFDILLLWERSKSLSPPHHINFFNPKSLKHLLQRVGFQLIEISTPGKLDWDIVEGMIRNEGVDLGRFWNFLTRANQGSKSELQDWIAKHNMSSHMSILAKR